MLSWLAEVSDQARARQAGWRTAIVVACFIAVLATGWLASESMTRRSSSRGPHVGSVQMSRDHGLRCENLEFVNETATLRSKGYGACAPIRTMQRPPEPESTQKPETLDGSAERLRSIGQSFKSR